MARALKDSWGMTLTDHEGQPAVIIGTVGPAGTANADGIVDLGNSLCYRREAS